LVSVLSRVISLKNVNGYKSPRILNENKNSYIVNLTKLLRSVTKTNEHINVKQESRAVARKSRDAACFCLHPM